MGKSHCTDIILTANVFDVICNGDNNGQIITSLYGGVTPYSFTWSDGDPNLVRNAVSPGTYEIAVIDGKGCKDSLIVEINEPSALMLNSTSIDNNCYDVQQGAIDLSVSGGVTPYNYYWQTREDTEDINGLSAGIYNVTVIDTNLCQQILADTIFEPNEIQITVTTTNILCNGGTTGSASLSSIGGLGNFTYLLLVG